MMNQLSSVVSRVLFAGSFVLGLLAVMDRLMNTLGYSLVGVGEQGPRWFLEMAAFALLFVIALQLRELKHGLSDSGGSGRE